MRPLRYVINVTLDGCCSHDALVPSRRLHEYSAEGIERADALLFGRVIYRMMEEAWRPAAETGVAADWMEAWMLPFARTIHKARKYVVSDSLGHVDWNAERIAGRDLVETVGRLKRQSGAGLMVGGVTLPLALARAGLIDEFEFIVHPRVAGRGPYLLAGLGKAVDLQLVEEKAIGDGAISRLYVPASGATLSPETP